MRRFACTLLFTCGLLICLAAKSHAYYQDKKESSQATAGEDAAKSKGQTAPPAPAKAATTTPPAPKVNVKAPQVNVNGARIGVTSPQVRTTAPRIDGTLPPMGGTAQPLPRGARGTTYDPYDGTPRGAGMGMGVYVPMQVPQREAAEAPPAYGNVPAPAPAAPGSVNIPAYDAGDVKPAPARKEEAAPVEPLAPAVGTPTPAAPAPQLSGRFAGIQGRTLHTWEFRADGTFEHAWTAAADGSGAASVEAGTYSVIGPYLTLAVWGRAGTRPAAPARGSQQIRRLRLGMLGPGAGNAILLDGVMLKPQNE